MVGLIRIGPWIRQFLWKSWPVISSLLFCILLLACRPVFYSYTSAFIQLEVSAPHQVDFMDFPINRFWVWWMTYPWSLLVIQFFVFIVHWIIDFDLQMFIIDLWCVVGSSCYYCRRVPNAAVLVCPSKGWLSAKQSSSFICLEANFLVVVVVVRCLATDLYCVAKCCSSSSF